MIARVKASRKFLYALPTSVVTWVRLASLDPQWDELLLVAVYLGNLASVLSFLSWTFYLSLAILAGILFLSGMDLPFI